jgi:hypothetical protein
MMNVPRMVVLARRGPCAPRPFSDEMVCSLRNPAR